MDYGNLEEGARKAGGKSILNLFESADFCVADRRLRDVGKGRDLREARRAKATDDHNVIDEAIAECGKDFTVFSIVRSRFPTYLSLTTSGSACGGDLQTTGEENEEYTVQRLFGQSCSSVSLVTPCLSHL